MTSPQNPSKNGRSAVASTCLSYYAALLFLLYLIIYAIAYPKVELLAAIAFEIAIFLMLIGWKLWRSKSESEQVKKVVLDQVRVEIPVIASGLKIWQRTALIFWLLVAVLMTIDLSALTLAFCGQSATARTLYIDLPISRGLGMHPAASLETLAGAYVEAKKYALAETFFNEIKAIRVQTYGPENDMMVALHTDFGDLYSKEKKYDQAISEYQTAITISKIIKGKTGYGRPLTGLANVQRERGDYQNAEKTYEEALAMRIRLYSPKSYRVAQTLKEYAKLLRLEGKTADADDMDKRRLAIEPEDSTLSSAQSSGQPLMTIGFCALSLLISYLLLSPKGLLTRFAVRRIKGHIETNKNGENKSRAGDLKNLVMLLKFQGDHQEARLYQDMIEKIKK